MASIYQKPGKPTWWVTHYLNGDCTRHSLRTRDERVAKRKLKKIEATLLSGEPWRPTTTPITSFLQEFCEHLATVRTPKSHANEICYLRGFFGRVLGA